MEPLRILELELLRHLTCDRFDPTGIPIEGRHRIGSLGSMKIEIRSNEHPPAHFHVIGPDLNVCFTIPGCEILPGFKSPKSDIVYRIKQFYKNNEARIIEVWNRTRPGDCSNVKIKESSSH